MMGDKYWDHGPFPYLGQNSYNGFMGVLEKNIDEVSPDEFLKMVLNALFEYNNEKYGEGIPLESWEYEWDDGVFEFETPDGTQYRLYIESWGDFCPEIREHCLVGEEIDEDCAYMVADSETFKGVKESYEAQFPYDKIVSAYYDLGFPESKYGSSIIIAKRGGD